MHYNELDLAVLFPPDDLRLSSCSDRHAIIGMQIQEIEAQGGEAWFLFEPKTIPLSDGAGRFWTRDRALPPELVELVPEDERQLVTLADKLEEQGRLEREAEEALLSPSGAVRQHAVDALREPVAYSRRQARNAVRLPDAALRVATTPVAVARVSSAPRAHGSRRTSRRSGSNARSPGREPDSDSEPPDHPGDDRGPS